MKKQFFFLMIALMAMNANAKVWRLNNSGGHADFTTWTAAYNGASANDTIYVESSPTSYGDANLSKPLVLIGTGYFLQENLPTQYKNIWNASFNRIDFRTGSEGSKMFGLNCNDGVYIYCGNIVVSKNKIIDVYLGGDNNYNNIKISQNFIGYIYSGGTNTITNVIINNNFIYKVWPAWSDYRPSSIILQSNISGSIINNTISGGFFYLAWWEQTFSPAMQVNGFYIVNNIIRQGAIENNGVSNLSSNNICNSTQLTAIDGNQVNVDMSTVFVGSGSTDGQWKLKAGSPAIGAGIGGVDCGMFGGSEPYVLSGMPSIPAIYDIVMPTAVVGNANLHVNVKAKAH
ncbi:MAG: hypothetical protein WCH34_05505 [Bacteroidota bacterium]